MPFDVGPQKKHTAHSVLLLRAAEIIAHPNDWNIGQTNQRRWWQRHTRYCAIGAVDRAAEIFELGDREEVEPFLDKAAQAHGFAEIAALNDHPDTTHTLVMQVFHEAVDLAME